ncbi:TPA: RICIN domain-containing protein [Bacillus thuringiensis]|uniref:Toxin n=1 Tax=Bacillus thuringiensis TaxID=1428 RepID=A0A0H4TM92_BACTU|nr:MULTISPECIES: RICIN domain-containing protein [Bacillus cereus group]AJA22341.1 toxin [Bacillus thuringiensis serovar galleriae]AKQ08662.1 toxin [Bacillus thuringiensis]EJQ17320.1 hypothetical protein IE5_04900 [Bacillus cereus BAG3X2-2]ETE89917.1 toxin [Bacillus thuringiensis serovar aizawai str. Leapi01]ETE90049.1 toxin [Bacillus thuringiensis serovar aizawai str. Hu4-2]
MKKKKIKRLPLPKKVITGLFVGAMALSIWAPESQAATPENNKYYNINLKANTWLKWNVEGASTNNGPTIRLWGGSNNENEKFTFFPLDGGLYAIVNKNSGKPVTVQSGSNILTQYSWTGSSNEQWYLRNQGNNYYEIVHQATGKVASYARNGNAEYVDLDDSNPYDPDRVFQISDAGASVQLPTLPTIGSRPNAPEYNPTGPIDQQLPQTSGSVVVGATSIPCIMVNDNQASDYTKIHNSPYYVLVKEEYWEKVRSEIIPAGGSSKYTVTTGVSTEDQQRMTDTLSMNFGADLGFKFKAVSASLQYGISKTLQTEISTTSTESTESTEEKTITSISGKDTGYTAYQLVTKYTLKRTDGSAVSSSWTVRDPNQTLVRTITN